MNDINHPIIMIMYARGVGGAELQFLELANYLTHSHKVRLLCLGGDGALKNVSLSKDIDIKVYAYHSKSSTVVSFLKAVVGNMFCPRKAVVSTSFYGNLLGYLISRFRNSNLVSMQTVSACMGQPNVDKFVLSRFNRLVAGAGDIREYLINHGQHSERIKVVHNWVDFSNRRVTKDADHVKDEFGVKGKTVIGCIGRLHPQKGQIYLIRAFSRIVKTVPNSVLVLVGDGPIRSKLENEVSSLGINESVIFTGGIEGDRYNDVLGMIDIYVQPSVFEGLPRTLLDAMFMEKPIVATEINGNKEAIESEVNGLLVKSKDSEGLYKAISRLLNSEHAKEIFSKSAKATALNRFSMDIQLKDIEKIINREE